MIDRRNRSRGRGPSRLYLFDQAGSGTRVSDAKLGDGVLQDLAITRRQEIAVVDQSTDVKLFKEDGSFLRSMHISRANEASLLQPGPESCSIATDSDGLIFVGDLDEKTVSVLTEDGNLKNCFQSDIAPFFMTTNGRQQLVICDSEEKKVNAVDQKGNVIFSIDSFTFDQCTVDQEDGLVGTPKGLTCDDKDNIYIVVGKPGTDPGDTLKNTNHIHEHSYCGRFRRCVTKDRYSPLGLSWHNGSLYIANTHNVLKFSPVCL